MAPIIDRGPVVSSAIGKTVWPFVRISKTVARVPLLTQYMLLMIREKYVSAYKYRNRLPA
jgi:hypothetical protein